MSAVDAVGALHGVAARHARIGIRPRVSVDPLAVDAPHARSGCLERHKVLAEAICVSIFAMGTAACAFEGVVELATFLIAAHLALGFLEVPWTAVIACGLANCSLEFSSCAFCAVGRGGQLGNCPHRTGVVTRRRSLPGLKVSGGALVANGLPRNRSKFTCIASRAGSRCGCPVGDRTGGAVNAFRLGRQRLVRSRAAGLDKEHVFFDAVRVREQQR